MKAAPHKFKIHYLLLGIVFIGLTIQACSTERKMAVAYTKKTPQINLLVLQPSTLFKVNQKVFLLDSLPQVPNEQQARLLIDNSLFLKKLDDSLFIANYFLGYMTELTKFGFIVYDESKMSSFMELDSNAIQISIAQIELEETLYSFKDETSIYGQTYFHDHELNAVYVNSWFDLNNITLPTAKQAVYFTTDMLVDEVDGVFDYDQFSGKVRYMYNIDSLNTNMLYRFAYDLGRVYAGYTFDFLLNQELNAKVPSEERSDRYFRYDPYTQTFFLAGEDRFISLDE